MAVSGHADGRTINVRIMKVCMFGNFFRLVTIGVAVISLSSPLRVHGSTSPSNEAVMLNGRALKHIGTGLREYLFLDIYTLDAYSESGACAPKRIVYDSEAKLVRFTMRRHVPIGYLWWQVKEAFKQNMPSGEADASKLEQKITSFLYLFKNDLPEGTTVEIAYVPGKGSTVTENGRALGPPIPGRDFQELAWRSFFFGGDACCEKMIIDQCSRAVR